MSLAEMTQGKLRILKAVSSLLEDPSSKITINQIAKVVHVTDAAIYRHYKSKDEIFASLLSYMEQNLLEFFEETETPTKVQQKVEDAFFLYMEFFESHPGLARLFLGHNASEASGMADRVTLLHSKMRSQLAQLFRLCQNRGELTEKFQPEQATEFFYGMLTGSAMAQAYGLPQLDAKERWDSFSKALFSNKKQ